MERNSQSPVTAVEDLRQAVSFLNEENRRATDTATDILRIPTAELWAMVVHISERLTYGVLSFLLESAKEELDRDACRAFTLSAIVVRRSRYAEAPEPMLLVLLRGRAWKEHGNALRSLGRLHGALAAAELAVAILSSNSALVVERTAALVLKAFITHQLGRAKEAAALLRECDAVFQRFDEKRRSLQVTIMEGTFLFDAGEVSAARTAFLGAKAVAEQLGDERELARVHNNLGQCEARLLNHAEALHHLRAALAGFDKLRMTAERQRVFWIFARMLRDAGEFTIAVTHLLQVRRELLERGMPVQAALAGIDLLELLAATGEWRELVRVATELVQVFNSAGMHQNARVALAYLAEQTRLHGDSISPFQSDLRRVRQYLCDLLVTPTAEFSVPEQH